MRRWLDERLGPSSNARRFAEALLRADAVEIQRSFGQVLVANASFQDVAHQPEVANHMLALGLLVPTLETHVAVQPRVRHRSI